MNEFISFFKFLFNAKLLVKLVKLKVVSLKKLPEFISFLLLQDHQLGKL